MDKDKKILIVGDCHSTDVFLLMKAYEDKYKGFDINSIKFTADPNYDCIGNLLNNQPCLASHLKSRIPKLALAKFQDADILIFDYRYTKKNINNLLDAIKSFDTTDKKIILLSPKIEFKNEITDWWIK